MTEETIPQRVRRAAKEYAHLHFGQWSDRKRNWISFAWERGHWAARNEFAEKLQRLSDAVDAWEENGDDVTLVETIDEVFGKDFDRLEQEKAA